jgi:hypothetical protein
VAPKRAEGTRPRANSKEMPTMAPRAAARRWPQCRSQCVDVGQRGRAGNAYGHRLSARSIPSRAPRPGPSSRPALSRRDRRPTASAQPQGSDFDPRSFTLSPSFSIDGGPAQLSPFGAFDPAYDVQPSPLRADPFRAALLSPQSLAAVTMPAPLQFARAAATTADSALGEQRAQALQAFTRTSSSRCVVRLWSSACAD